MKSVTFTKKSPGLTSILVGGRVVIVRRDKPVTVTVPDTVQVPRTQGVHVKVERLKQVQTTDLPPVSKPAPIPEPVKAIAPPEKKEEISVAMAPPEEETTEEDQNITVDEEDESEETEEAPKTKRRGRPKKSNRPSF